MVFLGVDDFGSNSPIGVNLQGSTYMASTSTAMRDPIFYRWHKRVDNLWHMWNDTQVIELATDAPPVEIRHCDIVMKKSGKPISDFIS